MDDEGSDDENTGDKTIKGQLPESVKATVNKPNHGLQHIKF